MSQKFMYSIGETSVMVIIDSRPRMVSLDTDQGKKLAAALRKPVQDEDEVRSLADVTSRLTKHTFGRVTVDDRDQLRLDGVVVDYGMSTIIIGLCREGADVTSLTNFLANVAENPNKGIANDLYQFISGGMLPITPDGYFLAFKRVRADFMDIHSGTVSYKLGEKPSMDRANCDENRHQTCSRGLHACSYNYLPHFGGSSDTIMIVKINPRDVTAIPTDYNLTKLRCCLMEVVDQVPEAEVKAFFNKAVDDRYSPKTATPETASDNTGNTGQTQVDKTDTVIASQEGDLTVDQVREWAFEDGGNASNGEGDATECDIEYGEHYAESINRFCLTYPIHFVAGFLDALGDLDDYHSETALEHGSEDALAVFDSNPDVEQAFDWTNGERFGYVPMDQEPTYVRGYLIKMLELQKTAHPNA